MIATERLSKHYGGRTVVDDVSFTLRTGTITGFLGPNGAGKSTTLRMLTGLTRPTAGRATIDGRAYAAIANPMWLVGTMLDASAVNPGRTGRTHLRTIATTIGVSPARVGEVLEHAGLADAATKRVSAYSLGMQQRLGIASAMLTDPPVLILDEPANGLDPEGIRWMRELLRARAARDGTVLLSSHQLGEVAQIADRLIVIGHGRVVADGGTAELLRGRAVRARALDAKALHDDLLVDGLRADLEPDGTVTVADTDTEAVGRSALRHGHVLLELRQAETDVEDLFFSLTGDGDGATHHRTDDHRLLGATR